MKKTFFNKGFTLIELLVVMAIIAVLTAIVTSNFPAAKSKSRDAKRISDIAQLQLTLEQIFDKCDTYPADITSLTDEICNVNGTSYTLGYFISSIPRDPTHATTPYVYEKSGSDPYLDYVLRASLENYGPTVTDDVDGLVLGVNCDDDITAPFYYCVQPK